MFPSFFAEETVQKDLDEYEEGQDGQPEETRGFTGFGGLRARGSTLALPFGG